MYVVHDVICGVVYCALSAVMFKGKSTIKFYNNGVMYMNETMYYSGTMYIIQSNIKFEGNSTVTFHNNSAAIGASLYIGDHSNIMFRRGYRVIFDCNEVFIGRTMYIDDQSNIKFNLFKGNSTVTFYNNHADTGGAMHINMLMIPESILKKTLQ